MIQTGHDPHLNASLDEQKWNLNVTCRCTGSEIAS